MSIRLSYDKKRPKRPYALKMRFVRTYSKDGLRTYRKSRASDLQKGQNYEPTVRLNYRHTERTELRTYTDKQNYKVRTNKGRSEG